MPPRRRLAGSVASALLVALAVALAFLGGGDSGAGATATELEIVSGADLRDLEAELGHAVYWVGERPPARIELERDAGGNVFLSYLPPGVGVGAEPGGYLTVGTYPVADADASTRRFARESAGRVLPGPAGSVVVPNPDSPGSVYLAYPDSDLQIEVFDPRPGRALALIRAGEVVPVGEG